MVTFSLRQASRVEANVQKREHKTLVRSDRGRRPAAVCEHLMDPMDDFLLASEVGNADYLVTGEGFCCFIRMNSSKGLLPMVSKASSSLSSR